MTGRVPSVVSMLTELGRPALHLVSCGGVTSGVSRLGGVPDLPAGLPWPRWRGAPLAFLGQIALADVPRPAPIPRLPDSGCLYFFYDAEQSTWGDAAEDAGSWRVLYWPAGADGAVQAPPADLTPEAAFPEKRVSMVPIVTLPDLQRVPIDLRSLDDGVLEAVDAATAAPFGDRPRHQIGGYPAPHQFDPMEEVADALARAPDTPPPTPASPPGESPGGAVGSDVWHLLLQLDSDDDTWMRWDEGGTLYFWVRERDLARGDFSRVWMIKQSM